MKTIESEKMNFDFTHNLSNHPLLNYDQLKRLALRHPDIRFNHSKLSRSQNLDTVIRDCPSDKSLTEALDNIQNADACIVIREVQKDQEYKKLIDEILKNIQRETKLKSSQMRNVNAWIFITSPGGVTPYHRDQETVFFYHLAGKKKFYLWDHHDKEVVTQEENEFFHGVNKLKETKYRDHIMEKSMVYDLTPEKGLYIPATAPHMVENGNEEFTISLSLTFMSDNDYRIRRIYKINQLLRKIRIKPRDINQSKIIDASKLMAHAALRSVLFFHKNWKNS